MLDSRGYRCDSVDSGEAAVAAALAKKYDLILMDCLMPGMDGFAAARMIRSSAEEAGTRIVGMSSMIMQGEYERGVEAGMDGMIAKPITVADLLASVSKVVGD
jgi:CheY-like chemotaxis protein